ncbi:hypothetical protein EXS71_02905 [Candidatus Uhrbacteria bacterium]|nr:hypothetical protein [Candidatus Uhrbacteria bacterium]
MNRYTESNPMHKIFSVLLTLSLLFPAGAALASTAPGSLIKGSNNSVYYVGADGKRYAFPNDKVFFSWVTNFNDIQTISDTELASYQLGGLITYRPGTRLVKVTTDPKVYAVGHGGVLRWIETQEIATALYGPTWNKQIDDVPDEFFINYSVGASIIKATDFNITSEQAASATVNDDKDLWTQKLSAPFIPLATTPAPSSTPQTPTPTQPSNNSYLVTISVSNMMPNSGAIISALAYATPSAGISKINIYSDNTLQKTCEYSPCGADLLVPGSNLKPSYDIRADVFWIDSHMTSSSVTITPKASSNSITVLSITRPEVKPKSTQEIVVSVGSNFVAKYLDIFIDGGAARGCADTQVCRYAFMELGAIGTTHVVYGIAKDANGFSQRSPDRTYQVVSNDHPLVQITTGKNSIFQGETVDVSVNASDDDGITTSEIWLDGALLKRCQTSVCTTIAGPWYTPRTINFVGKANDATGLQGSTTSTNVVVQQSYGGY